MISASGPIGYIGDAMTNSEMTDKPTAIQIAAARSNGEELYAIVNGSGTIMGYRFEKPK